MKKQKKLLSSTLRPGSAALAGTIATLAYSVAMEGDKFLIGNYFNDVQFIQGILEGQKQTTRGTVLSWAIHIFNGVALAEIYAAVVKRFIPGPGWLKGAIFGELFIASAWALTPLADKYHPLIKNGEMPPLANKKSFVQNLLRHLIFGLTLGLLYKD
ncbi:MAG TPA: DUF6789 family protein [Dictyobacter sp.]|jgi:hypothetical protein|nr:DUF6789 family protein [Dictyobacter sp.]